MNKTFEQYLLQVGIRSHEFTYDYETLADNIQYFMQCHADHLSAYKALTFFHMHLEDKKK